MALLEYDDYMLAWYVVTGQVFLTVVQMFYYNRAPLQEGVVWCPGLLMNLLQYISVKVPR